MKIKRSIVEIDEDLCDGCGQCIPACSEGAIRIINGKARLVAEKYCDGLGACLGECPNNALRICEREVDEFDPEAVEQYLKSQESAEKQAESEMACGCPSTYVQEFAAKSASKEANQSMNRTSTISALTHWPVQIRLVPPTAPFLKGAHLLVAADCTTVAIPDFHRDLLKGKVILIGCPKFDDVDSYIWKFGEIFKIADIKDITVVVMEVPCCQGLPRIIKKGMEIAGKKVPMEQLIISAKGEILKKEKLAV